MEVCETIAVSPESRPTVLRCVWQVNAEGPLLVVATLSFTSLQNKSNSVVFCVADVCNAIINAIG